MDSKTPSISWETVYIFISSTFNDMHAERDLLVKKVFPELTEWCEERRLRLVDVDLRWGVTEEEATRNKNVVEVCLDRIDKCRPFFLCFLGQRYGWIPRAEDVHRETTRKFPGLDVALAGGRSVTELEILHAVISPFHHGEPGSRESQDPTQHAFFYLRDDSYLDELPDQPEYLKRIYTDKAEKSWGKRWLLRRKQKKLKNSTIPATGCPVTHYRATWSEELRSPELAIPLQCPALLEENVDRWKQQWEEAVRVQVSGTDVTENTDAHGVAEEFNQNITIGRLTGFNVAGQTLEEVILRQLKDAIAQRYPHHFQEVEENELSRELDDQEQFLLDTTIGFVRREQDFEALDSYVRSDTNRLFVLTGPNGIGKSTLLGKWIKEYRRQLPRNSGESIHFRFIGRSHLSGGVTDLLFSFLEELQTVARKVPKTKRELRHNRAGEEVEVDVPLLIPKDPKGVETLWDEWVSGILVQGHVQKGKTVLVLDGLDQLPGGVSDLSWLPRTLPPHLKLVVSFRRDTQSDEPLPSILREGGDSWHEEMRPFTDEAHRQSLVRGYLRQYLKELDDRHILDLIRSDGAENPLYLKIVLAELRVFGAPAGLGEKIREAFGNSPLTAFDSVLERLEKDPAYTPLAPQYVVPMIFGLLAHARRGLSVSELANMMSTGAFPPEAGNVSMKTATDSIHFFLRQMRPYLARREGRFDFFFPSLKDAVKRRYLGTGPTAQTGRIEAAGWHKVLANFFFDAPTWLALGESTERAMCEGSDQPNIRKVTELPYQLTGARDFSRLECVLSDMDFVDAKSLAGMAGDLAEDYQRAGIMSQPSELTSERVLKFENRLGSQCLLCGGWGDVHETDLGHTVPCPYCGFLQSINPEWEEGEWHPSPPPKGYAGTGKDRTFVFSSGVKEYARFVTDQLHFLARFPTIALQQATNLPDTSVLSKAARELIRSKERPRPWIEFLNKPQALVRRLAIPFPTEECAYSPDGSRILSRMKSELRKWDAETGLELERIYNHSGPLVAEESATWDTLEGDLALPEGPLWAVSPDGRRVVKGYSLLDASTGGKVGRISPLHLSEDLRVCAFSPDSRRLACGTIRGLDVLDVDAIEQEFMVDPETTPFVSLWEWVIGLSYSPDGKRIAVHQRNDEGFPKVLAIEENRLEVLPGHNSPILACAFSLEGDRLVSTSGTDLRVWDVLQGVGSNPPVLLSGGSMDEDLEDEDWYDSYEGHDDVISACAIAPDGNSAVSGSKDETLIIWDVDSREVKAVLTGHECPVTVCEYCPDGFWIVSGDEDGIVRIWDADSGKEVEVLKSHSQSVTSCAWSPNGELVLTGSEDGTLAVWDNESEEERARLAPDTGPVRGCRFSPVGDRIFSLSAGGILTIWDGVTFARLEERQGPVDSVTCCSFSHDCRQVVCAADATLLVWNTSEETVSARFTGHTGPVRCCVFSPDGEYVVSGGEDRTLRKWSASKGSGGIMKGHTALLGACAFFPEGNLIVTGYEDGNIWIWDAVTGAMVRQVDSYHRGSIYTCAVSPDGAAIATGGFDESVHLYDARSGQLSDFLPLDDDVVLCLFSPYGERLLCVADDEVTVWDLGEGQGIYNLDNSNPLLRFDGGRPCAFSPDGKRIAICPAGGTLTLHDVETGEVQTTLEIPRVRDCVFIGGQRFLVTTSGNQLVELWDTSDGRRLAVFPTGDKPTALAHSLAAKEVAVGGFDGGFYRLRVHLPDPPSVKGERSTSPTSSNSP